MNIISGADGCKAGWVMVSKDLETGQISWQLCKDAISLIYSEPIPQILAIDIPVGLPNIGSRDCDKEARRLLGPGRGSSVFPAPLRPVLAAATYKEACDIRFKIEGKKMSCQAWGIVPKIQDVDEVLCDDIKLQSRVREIHPEICFFVIKGSIPAQFSKKKQAGRDERLSLLEPFFGDALAAALSEKSILESQTDDILDAFAALWTAERIAKGESQTIPVAPPLDSRNLRMEIVF